MKIRQSWFKRLFHSGVLFYILLVALALVYILPFIIQIATSVSYTHLTLPTNSLV